MELSKKVNDTPDLGTISVYVGSRDIRCLPPPYKLYMDTAGVVFSEKVFFGLRCSSSQLNDFIGRR